MKNLLLVRNLIVSVVPFLVVVGACSIYAITPAPDGGYPGDNTAEGTNALSNDDTSTGLYNTAVGAAALYANTTGSSNTAIGQHALIDNTSGSYNTATGFQALDSNYTGGYHTAVGEQALKRNFNGGFNTATGAGALANNISGGGNTAADTNALLGNSTGNYNTASGYEALLNNQDGSDNVAEGVDALFANTSGGANIAIGPSALLLNSAGNNNVAVGHSALHSDSGSYNTAVGASAGQDLTTGSNNIDIGANVFGKKGETNTVRIVVQGTQKATFIAGISGKTVASGVGVIINSNGQLRTIQSSARFKSDIKPMDNASEALLRLKPVTFYYKEELDPDKIPQFGLIAEEVEKVNRDLVVRDDEGMVMAVRYDAVNAMLLNEFLKQRQKLEKERKDYKHEFAEQAKEIATLTAEVKAQRAEIKKVTAQVQVSKPGSQLVADKQ